MKKHLLFLMLALPAAATPAAAQSAQLDANNVNARINAAGDLFWDFMNARFEVPKGSGKHTLFSGNLWIGGIDAGSQLHLAAQTYRQAGTDFFQGPISTAYSATYDSQWNKVWKIDKSTIDNFRLYLLNPSAYPNYTVPSVIIDWPAHGNPANNEASNLAPFVDSNMDGQYNYQDGDFPCIKGDQAVYFLFNDQRNTHGETGGLPLGIEVHGMAYSFNNPSDTALNHTIFINYKIINRAASTYNNTYVGMWADLDIGDYADDFIGADVMRNAYYGYNGDANDGTGGSGTYGADPPAQAVVLLKGPIADPNDGIDNDRNGALDEAGETWGMAKFMAYNNDVTAQGNPSSTAGFYNYLTGTWLDGLPITYGGNGYNTGGPNADIMYPGSSDPMGWSTGMQPQATWDEAIAGNTPGDRRGLGTSGPFTFQPGQMLCLDYAFVYARPLPGGQLGAIPLLENRIDHIQALYDSTLNNCGCVVTPLPAGLNEQALSENIEVFPNPATDMIHIDMANIPGVRNYVITDVVGRQVKAGVLSSNTLNAIALSELSEGTYVIRISGENTLTVRRITKQ